MRSACANHLPVPFAESHGIVHGDPPDAFFTLFCGGAQRLSGGTTLITESCRGRAFEVTRDGEVVWEYVNPHRAGEDGEWIASLLEVRRVPTSAVDAWLER